MATYRETFTTTAPAPEVFEYLARFSSAAEWDPSVLAASDVGPGDQPVGVGSAFDLTLRIAGRDKVMRYVVTDIDRPQSVTVRAEAASFVSEDTIEVIDEGTSVTVVYHAELRPRGIAKLLSPVFDRAFNRFAERGAEGLRRQLEQQGVASARGAHEAGPS